MYLRIRHNILYSRHESHPVRFTHVATGTFAENKYYCGVCEVDGERCCFRDTEISDFEIVDEGRPADDHDHVRWLLTIAAEIHQKA